MGVLLLAMLPLWMLNMRGLKVLVTSEWFFIPTEQGLAVALGVFWVLCLVLMWVVMLLKALWRGPSAEEPWWKRAIAQMVMGGDARPNRAATQGATDALP